jgi:hypothetical protein
MRRRPLMVMAIIIVVAAAELVGIADKLKLSHPKSKPS